MARSSEDWRDLFEDAAKSFSPQSSETSETITAKGLDVTDITTLAGFIDHTLLKLDATQSQIDALCEEAVRYRFKSVCIRLPWVLRAVDKLQGNPVVVACVVGFHEGTASSTDKAQEAIAAVAAGARELDMVINHVLLQQQEYQMVFEDILAVRKAAPSPTVLKVILETSVLSPVQIIAACKLAEAAGADFVKTSTGFNGAGATISNVRLMKRVVGDGMKVKASGGIRTADDCVAMIRAGAERIGASSGVQIVTQPRNRGTGHQTSQANTEIISDGSNAY